LPFKILLKVVHNLSRVTPDMDSFIGGGSTNETLDLVYLQKPGTKVLYFQETDRPPSLQQNPALQTCATFPF